MSSPVKSLVKSIIKVQRRTDAPIFQQVADQLADCIRKGILAPGIQLPGSRELAGALKVHRKTIIAVYEELNIQGWVVVRPYKGTFVSEVLPIMEGISLPPGRPPLRIYPSNTGYAFRQNILFDKIPDTSRSEFTFNDGLPDIKMTPILKLGVVYNRLIQRRQAKRYVNYAREASNEHFREILASYLNNTRGLRITQKNILTTKSVHMATFLAASTLLNAGDIVIIGELSYYINNMIFQQAGATLVQVPTDQHGISTDAIREICRKQKVRMVYVMPHSHYPTTSVLSAERRIDLLQLASEYGFVILEDDHEFDFQFDNTPMLPMASADNNGMVIYTGSFSKSLAPGFAVGYLIAPENLITELSKFSDMLASYGDAITEQCIAEFIMDGDMQRHLNKSLKLYHKRRDAIATLLHSQLGDYVQFNIPPAGLAIWTTWHKQLNLLKISRECATLGLSLPQHLLYQTRKATGMRLGFASFSEEKLRDTILMMYHGVLNSTR